METYIPSTAHSDAVPKVSCLLVTADRSRLCRRAVQCYQRQTYANKELIVVDDGAEDLAPVLSELSKGEVTYVKLEKKPENVLGRLRNVALEAASGELLTQWDDDDWYHPDRIARQARILHQGYDACTLSGSLMHLDTERFFHHPYIGLLKDGVPGTIMHRRSEAIRYPEVPRGEDTTYLQDWREQRYAKLPPSDAYLFIRCFHGENTWEKKHFLTRMRNTPRDLIAYTWHRYVRGNLFAHARFQLNRQARDAFQRYLEDSFALGLLNRSPTEAPTFPKSRRPSS